MAASSPGPRQQRTYGNWRRPQTAGVGALGLVGTVVLMAGMILVVLVAIKSLWAAVALLLLLGLILAPMAVRDRDGRTLMVRMGAALGWRMTVKAGADYYRSGPLGRTGYGTCTLPGLAASSTLMEAQDAYGRPFAMLSYPTNHHAVVLSCDADGAGLVDQDQVDIWVAHWGQWLANLATEPGLIGASVTVETAPDTGIRLAEEVNTNLSPDAPPLAAAMLRDVLATYPAGSAQISTRITLTYSGAARPGHERRTADDMAVLIGHRLPGLTSTLAMTGAGPARPMTARQLAEAVRIAYDPSVAALVEEAQHSGGTGLTWDEAGPASSDEAVGTYAHDGACSITWSMSEAPRGAVLSSVLTGFLQPSDDIARKRVTLLYRPHDPASATHIVQRDKRDAEFKAGSTKGNRARDDVAVKAARQSEEEEATGAGVVRFALLATATVTDRADLPRAEAAMDNLAAPARIRLRRMTRTQAASFAAALPIGLVLPAHVMVPSTVRDNL
ncbi:SCO6880 family protein [Streptomyces sp. NBC_01431]|uniref:SCO6880 family protein n=1 Tax=Streptomyces sp. NBC_01431 TaxID=2903863 RepID=UPI002E332C7A|nr:SCO6880 family protein [Streptomyces sp. NBC_01431]